MASGHSSWLAYFEFVFGSSRSLSASTCLASSCWLVRQAYSICACWASLLKRQSGASNLNEQLLPWAWSGFALMVIGGLLMFSSEAVKVYANGAFRLKMCLILLAGINALVFQTTVYKTVDKWDLLPRPPIGARLAGSVLSLVLWVGVIFAGRWIAY